MVRCCKQTYSLGVDRSQDTNTHSRKVNRVSMQLRKRATRGLAVSSNSAIDTTCTWGWNSKTGVQDAYLSRDGWPCQKVHVNQCQRENSSAIPELQGREKGVHQLEAKAAVDVDLQQFGIRPSARIACQPGTRTLGPDTLRASGSHCDQERTACRLRAAHRARAARATLVAA